MKKTQIDENVWEEKWRGENNFSLPAADAIVNTFSHFFYVSYRPLCLSSSMYVAMCLRFSSSHVSKCAFCCFFSFLIRRYFLFTTHNFYLLPSLLGLLFAFEEIFMDVEKLASPRREPIKRGTKNLMLEKRIRFD